MIIIIFILLMSTSQIVLIVVEMDHSKTKAKFQIHSKKNCWYQVSNYKHIILHRNNKITKKIEKKEERDRFTNQGC